MREEEYILTINKYGDKFWKNKEGIYHRIDGPTVEYVDGTKFKMGENAPKKLNAIVRSMRKDLFKYLQQA